MTTAQRNADAAMRREAIRLALEHVDAARGLLAGWVEDDDMDEEKRGKQNERGAVE